METNIFNPALGHEYKEYVYQCLKEAYKGSGIYGMRHFLNNRDEIQLIFPVDEELIAYSVSRDLYSPKIDTNKPEILERVEYPELSYDEELYKGFNLAS